MRRYSVLIVQPDSSAQATTVAAASKPEAEAKAQAMAGSEAKVYVDLIAVRRSGR